MLYAVRRGPFALEHQPLAALHELLNYAFGRAMLRIEALSADDWLTLASSSAVRCGMSTSARVEPLIRSVRVSDDEIAAELSDGRRITVPLAWSWRLSQATPEQRANHRLIGSGQGIHWPDVDEDISLDDMLNGMPAPRTRR